MEKLLYLWKRLPPALRARPVPAQITTNSRCDNLLSRPAAGVTETALTNLRCHSTGLTPINLMHQAGRLRLHDKNKRKGKHSCV